jgi:anti-sigma B factor antagonist
MHLEIDAQDDGVLVVHGEIDMANAFMLHDAIEVLTGPAVVDLAGVTFIDSTGIQVLIRQHQRRETVGEPLVVKDPSSQVLRVLDVAGLLGYLRINADGVDPGDGAST